MATIQPAPTYAEVILVNEQTRKATFNPIWLKWFLDLAQTINTADAHNSLTGLQGGTASEFYHMTAAEDALLALLVPGVWTPTLTEVTNLDASTAFQSQYLRAGSLVVASGKVAANPTAAGAVQLDLSLPVASNFGVAQDCGGVAFAPGVAGQGAAITAEIANNRAAMEWIAVDTANRTMAFIFAYRII